VSAVSRLGLAIVVVACNHTPSRITAVEPPSAVPAAVPTAELPPLPTFDFELAHAITRRGPTRPQRVVIISEDGMRPDAIDAENAPNHIALMREGMIARRAFTVSPSETLCSHASMLSGFSVADHKMSFDGFKAERGQIALPTIFAIAREHDLSTAMFIAKQKLWHLAPEGSVDHFEKPGFFCRVVASRAASYFEATLPHLMFVHLADPDNAGHAKGWMSPEYMTAVRESDRCLQVILDAIDRSGTASSTLVIVTADHGGSGRSHSGRGKELDRMIPWIVRGPAIPPNTLLDADIATVDTAVTALTALQLPTRPGMVGVSWYPPPATSLREANEPPPPQPPIP
jgi:arylsulfatase A-like enzyme